MKSIDFIFFDAGGGHRSAATALKAVAEQQNRDWKVRLVNLQEVLDSLDIFRKLTGVRLEDLYNLMLAKGWTLGSEHLLKLIHGVIRLYHPAQVRMLARFWSQETPGMVVSLVPNFNRALFQGVRQVSPHVPFVSILTDFADYPPHFWMERQDQYMICGTARAVEQARKMGYDPKKIFQVSGMILRPSFYHDFSLNRADERERLGLDPSLPAGLVLFGGQGSSVMEKIVRRLQKCRSGLQIIAICGRNEKLASRLRAIPSRFPLVVTGFTSEVPYYMWLSDFFIGKPGPGSISEAVAMKLPVIIERNSWTLPQERYNAEWVRENQAGIVVENFKTIDEAVDRLLVPAHFESYRAAVCAIQNRAAYEIPDILETILEQS